MLYLSYAAVRHVREGEGHYYILSGEQVEPHEVVLIHQDWKPGVDVVSWPMPDDSGAFEQADPDPQYLGTSYLDMIARVSYNLGDWTPTEIASLFNAIWKQGDGSWISGTAEQWEAAGKLQPMRFVPGTQIQGVEND